MIFQDDLLFPHLRVGDNIGFGLNGQDSGREEGARGRGRRALRRGASARSRVRRRSPAASVSAWGWPGRWRLGRGSCSATSRSRHSTCPIARPCSSGSQAVQRAEGIPVLYVTHSPAEAIGLGTRLFLLERGQDPRRGASARRPGQQRGCLVRPSRRRSQRPPRARRGPFPGHGTTRLQLEQGPLLIVPFLDVEPGTAVTVEIRAEDILLARGPISGLSAQNLIEGIVERIVPHGSEAEVLIRTGGVTWIVSVVAPAIDQLSLAPGCRRAHDHQGEKLSCEPNIGISRSIPDAGAQLRILPFAAACPAFLMEPGAVDHDEPPAFLCVSFISYLLKPVPRAP